MSSLTPFMKDKCTQALSDNNIRYAFNEEHNYIYIPDYGMVINIEELALKDLDYVILSHRQNYLTIKRLLAKAMKTCAS
jgi:hypothetical protein